MRITACKKKTAQFNKTPRALIPSFRFGRMSREQLDGSVGCSYRVWKEGHAPTIVRHCYVPSPSPSMMIGEYVHQQTVIATLHVRMDVLQLNTSLNTMEYQNLMRSLTLLRTDTTPFSLMENYIVSFIVIYWYVYMYTPSKYCFLVLTTFPKGVKFIKH